MKNRQGLSTEAVARKAICASIAYYGLDESLVPDHTFDAWCQRLHDEWDDLSRVTQWKLGDPHSISASGFHIRVSTLDLGAVATWLRLEGRMRYQIVTNWAPPSDELPEREAFAWSTAPEVFWNKKRPIQ